MSYVAVGDDGLVLRLGTEGVLHREFTSNFNVNGVARTRVEQLEVFVAVTDNGDTFHSTGGDWERSGVSADCHPSFSTLHAIGFARGTTFGFAAGDSGNIVVTPNAKGWEFLSHITNRNLRAVCAANKHTVWVAGDEGEIHMSSNVTQETRVQVGEEFAYQTIIDPAIKWTPINTHVTKHLRGIAVGHGMVIAVGDDGTVVYLRSRKWGHTQITGKNLRAVAMSPGGKVIAVGDDGWIGIRKLAGTGSEASQWTEYTNVTSKHLRGVVAHNDNYWAIVGDAAFLTTNDGGGHWHQHENDGTLNAVC